MQTRKIVKVIKNIILGNLTFKNADFFICVLLFILSFSFYSHFVYYNVGGDAVSMYYPAKKLLQENSLNFWDPLNDQYNTYYFKLPFTDTVIYDWGKSYPIQTPGAILLSAFTIGAFGNNAFFYINAFFASLTIIFIYLISKELIKDRKLALLSALVLFSMPVFVFWGIIIQSIMPATTCLVVSLYFILKFQNRNYLSFLFLSGLFFAFSVFIRWPFFLFFPAFLVFFYDRNKKFKFDFKRLFQFTIPIFLVFIFILLYNLKYYHDPFFIGYLKSNYHPVPPGYEQTSNQTGQVYLLSGLSLTSIISAVLDSIKYFFVGSHKIFFVLLPVALLGFFIKMEDERAKKLKTFFLVIFAISLFYYGSLEPNFWKPEESGHYWSLSLVFFRYLLPIYVLSVALLSFVISKVFNLIKNKRIGTLIYFLMTILAVIYINVSIDWKGGSNLRYIQNIYQETIDYSKQLNLNLRKNSVILYATRWPFSYTYPHSIEYDWFYYDGVPPECKLKHTKEVVKKLLGDKRTVYFVHYDEPYNTLTKNVEEELRKEFKFTLVDGTYFHRMKVRFYQLSSYKNE